MDTPNTARPAGRGGRRVVELLLAVVFLTAIGAAAGYILGHNVRDNRNGGPAAEDTPTGEPTTAGAAATRLCLDVTERDAKSRFHSPGGLVQVLYIRTDQSEVWICKDKSNNLFYQGHVLSPGEQPANRAVFTDTNSLILQTVSRDGSGGYVAENSDGNGTTRYRVSAERLVIERADGRTDRQDVVAHEP
jgi:hypothetical protein